MYLITGPANLKLSLSRGKRWIPGIGSLPREQASQSSVESRSLITRILLVLLTGSSRLWFRARGIRVTTWLIVLLLPAVPAGFSINYPNQGAAAIFTSNLLAMVPLGAILTFVTDELIVRRGGHEALLVVVTTGFVTSAPPEIENRLNAYVSQQIGTLCN